MISHQALGTIWVGHTWYHLSSSMITVGRGSLNPALNTSSYKVTQVTDLMVTLSDEPSNSNPIDARIENSQILTKSSSPKTNLITSGVSSATIDLVTKSPKTDQENKAIEKEKEKGYPPSLS